jgi:hypothetical protein
MKKVLPYIVDTLKKSNVKYKVHSFESGAVMVDIWIDNDFFVIQIDGETIGLSLITKETTPFDIIPDKTFKNETLFKNAFENIFRPSRVSL